MPASLPPPARAPLVPPPLPLRDTRAPRRPSTPSPPSPTRRPRPTADTSLVPSLLASCHSPAAGSLAAATTVAAASQPRLPASPSAPSGGSPTSTQVSPRPLASPKPKLLMGVTRALVRRCAGRMRSKLNVPDLSEVKRKKENEIVSIHQLPC